MSHKGYRSGSIRKDGRLGQPSSRVSCVDLEALERRMLLSTAAGVLDPTFATNGVKTITADQGLGLNTDAAVSPPGGKTLLVGDSLPLALGLARFDANG